MSPNIQGFIQAKVVAKTIFDTIDRVPEIKDHENCKDNFEIIETISFEGISFRYPTAPENVPNVFNKVDFKIRAGETTAIVGPSGMGKSTIV